MGLLGFLAGAGGPWAYATRSLGPGRGAARLQGCSRALRSRAGGACWASEHCSALHLLELKRAQGGNSFLAGGRAHFSLHELLAVLASASYTSSL